MAKNDRMLIDGIIEDRVREKIPSDKPDEVFEYFCFEQILKDLDLTPDEINSGWIDGRSDGGIDGFYILVNGHLLQEAEGFNWPKTGSELVVNIVTCKHHDTFKQATLDTLAATLVEIFDFSIEIANLNGSYSDELLRQRNNLQLAYRRLSPRLNKFKVNFSYASRGDTSHIGDEVAARAKHIESIAQESFTKCEPQFKFVGATEFVDLYRKAPNYSLELPFIEVLSRGETYVLLARLEEYYKFVTDTDGKLRRYLFDSNVRDFMGLNRVNDDIRATLQDDSSPDFWWLNNGVTILATAASLVGKSINVQDIQIVNGLQTTESIFRYFESGINDSKDRAVLVKVIVSQQDSVRDSIIRATNNQTAVDQISLHATDRIQRDIEETLHRSGIYYERRNRFYANQGHSVHEIVTPLYIAAGATALILKLPHIAGSFREKYIRATQANEAVFSDKFPLGVWPNIVRLYKQVDRILESVRPRGGGSIERFLKNNRHPVCLIAVAKHFGKFDFTPQDLATLDASKISDDAVRDVWARISLATKDKRQRFTVKASIVALFSTIGKEIGISGIARIEHAPNIITPLATHYGNASVRVDMQFAKQVHALLTPQPWKPGSHKSICEKLACTDSEYFAAVALLIDDGLVNRQRDGVVYDAEGNVLCIDPERVDPVSLELK